MDIDERLRKWWLFGEYTGGDCPNCGRQRLMSSEDNEGNERIICEKCMWEPTRQKYLSETEPDYDN